MSDEAAEKGTVLDGRFALTREVRDGGMATVTKAWDLLNDQPCAIKRMKHTPDVLRTKESFFREQKALSELGHHENIVTLIHVGIDQGEPYMALEWLPFNLEQWILRRGPLRWPEYFEQVGRPILRAVAFAQNRGWIHRDIKPSNILMTEHGVPKLSDYGISRNTARPRLGMTFAGFQSAPFTSPEPDDGGEYSMSRDCFSLAAVSVFCLSGKKPENYGELTELLRQLDQTSNPVQLLGSAMSQDPAERPVLASGMLAELEQFEDRRRRTLEDRVTCHLKIHARCLAIAQRVLGTRERQLVEKSFLDELNEVCGIRSIKVDGQPGWRVSAAGWVFDMIRLGHEPYLTVTKAWRSRESEVERYREVSFSPSVEFTFRDPADPEQAAPTLDDLEMRLSEFESAAKLAAQQSRQERAFRLWYSFLAARLDYETSKENAISFVELRRNDNTLTLRTELPPPPDIVGQSRLIRVGATHRVFCEVLDANLDEITVSVTSGDPSRLQRRGLLEVNSVAAEKAIDRQRSALDAINYDRAASVRLKAILLNPGTAQPPVPVNANPPPGGKFDHEKMRVLGTALGIQEVLAVKGPPGTGKTNLIAEIIVQYLERNPHHRVLLSSQTHVALDNVIGRVGTRNESLEIVRIGKLDDPRIEPKSRELLLDRKAEVWAARARKKAEAYLTRWAEHRGIDRSRIEIGVLAERLRIILEQMEQVRFTLQRAEQRTEQIEKSEPEPSTPGSTTSEIDAEAEKAEETLTDSRRALARLRIARDETRARLVESGGYGKDLAQGSLSDLAEWSQMMLGDSPDEVKCKELLTLQEQWLLRLGRSSDFHAAMLASAQVVAGTCVGVAGIRGAAGITYDLCIVDEASKATVTEILVPMSRSRKWILVGDPEQLPPFFEDESLKALTDFEGQEIRRTLLDRFIAGLPQSCIETLRNQYRMVKPIGDLISETFYGGTLVSPVTKPNVQLTGVYPKAVTWLSTQKLPDRGETSDGLSYRNDCECLVLREALAHINFIARRRKAIYDVAVIAGYVAQVRAIEDSIRDHRHEWEGIIVKCNTVDAFQGNQAEVCLYSVTRSNRDKRLGFLREKPRLNVALSRGKSALIIVGDDEFCRDADGAEYFRKVLQFIDLHNDECELRILQ